MAQVSLFCHSFFIHTFSSIPINKHIRIYAVFIKNLKNFINIINFKELLLSKTKSNGFVCFLSNIADDTPIATFTKSGAFSLTNFLCLAADIDVFNVIDLARNTKDIYSVRCNMQIRVISIGKLCNKYVFGTLIANN